MNGCVVATGSSGVVWDVLGLWHFESQFLFDNFPIDSSLLLRLGCPSHRAHVTCPFSFKLLAVFHLDSRRDGERVTLNSVMSVLGVPQGAYYSLDGMDLASLKNLGFCSHRRQQEQEYGWIWRAQRECRGSESVWLPMF